MVLHPLLKIKRLNTTTLSKSYTIFLLLYWYFFLCICMSTCVHMWMNGHVCACMWTYMCLHAPEVRVWYKKHPDLPSTLLNVVTSQSNPELNNIICVACQFSLEMPLLCFLKQKLQASCHTHLTSLWVLEIQTQFLMLECKDFFFLTSKWFQ